MGKQNNNKHLSEDAIKKLGTMTDRKVAEIFHVPAQLVHKVRNDLNIPAYRKHSVMHLKKMSDVQFTELKDLLGTDRDNRLAKRFNVTREYVRQLRKKFDVPKYIKFKN